MSTDVQFVSSGNAAQVRDLFRAFSTAPIPQIVDQVTALVMDSHDPDVTTAILEAFGGDVP